MKKTIILLIALTLSTFVMAQEKTKVKELGLTFWYLDDFGFSYKVGTEQSLWRFNAISLSGNNESENLDNEDRYNDHFGIRLSAGKEYRKLIAENIEYRYGFDLSFNYNYIKINRGSNSDPIKEKRDLFTPGFNLVLGLNYIIGDHLVLGAEIMPYLNYTFGQSTQKRRIEEYNEKGDYSSFNYGFDNSSVLLSIAYRF